MLFWFQVTGNYLNTLNRKTYWRGAEISFRVQVETNLLGANISNWKIGNGTAFSSPLHFSLRHAFYVVLHDRESFLLLLFKTLSLHCLVPDKGYFWISDSNFLKTWPSVQQPSGEAENRVMVAKVHQRGWGAVRKGVITFWEDTPWRSSAALGWMASIC